ncbi:MAG: D-glycero-beta-D-manno-heptose 1,7-bisphosphate 7-phosphatase [Nitrospirae bacterium]|nr:D-glycero-beta-D-manno-heptose 1,7-bisphosphate 7-phosphatase [Nitrospirota bacterium]MCL5976718.1 D-glycero-beta-D-manno-heptose 1,7-bisphosphate 7-phosphatase [Nitrospirota bacterium]
MLGTIIKKPEQAVILAGGMGTRLRPLTNTRPKPMIEFNNKPFLQYLIELLREQGFARILLLLGYLPEVIIDYFEDGKAFGIDIDYSVTEVSNETGRRLKLASEKIDDYFFLMYCDNYWPMDFDRMWMHFVKQRVIAQTTVYRNSDNYTKSNVQFDNSKVVCYDKSRRGVGLNGVDIGYCIFKKEVIDLIPDENINFEGAVYPLLTQRNQLAAYVTDHRYYSVGSHERLGITEAFLKDKKAIILDRDGVINRKPAKADYVKTWDEFEWLEGSREAIRLLKESGYQVIVITNQAGIARGIMSEDDLEDIHAKMNTDLLRYNAQIDRFYYCPHGWDDGCDCRKPKPGMLYKAQQDYNLNLTKTVFIGDDYRDKEAGDAAGCRTILVSQGESLFETVKDLLI